jgi:hypothetical protein
MVLPGVALVSCRVRIKTSRRTALAVDTMQGITIGLLAGTVAWELLWVAWLVWKVFF